MKPTIASSDDIFEICKIYFDVYHGKYSDPLMSDPLSLRAFIESGSGFWFVTKDDQGHVVASVVISYDDVNMIAKAYAAVVRDHLRGQGVMEKLLTFGIDYVRTKTPGVDIIYSATRTVHEIAQNLTEKLGFKKLGIFPNAHKSEDFETLCLAAIIYPHALAERHDDYKLHYELESLYEVVKNEVGLSHLETIVPVETSKSLVSPKDLELITAPKFVQHRYESLKQEKKLQFEFFPFHQPNLVVISPDSSIEVFCHKSPVDGYCVIVGAKIPENINYTELFLKTNNLLRDYGARYIEVLIRADKPKIIENVLRAKFIPSGFFPAFQKIGNKRHDFLVLSRSFEIFDFQNVKLKGLNQVYLEEYYKAWKRMSLSPKLLSL